MAYEQTLYRVVKDHIKPAVIKKKNRYSKWEYGYNAEYDTVIITAGLPFGKAGMTNMIRLYKVGN